MQVPPRFGGKVSTFDATKAKAVPGVVDVVQIPRGVAVVAREHVLEPFLVQHVDRFRERVEQIGGRRVGKEAGAVGFEHRLPVPVGAR